ncbi:hypothetical protein AAF712_008074 [Marasmius tenuissimus]|uniref:Uncharacterized protein n=1 Tax=Marasmius tenuissimus TaxID=585030 RepID=A0ABR2ZTE5_9AGAR
MSYSNPLHPPITSTHLSPYNALHRAMQASPSTRRHVPHPTESKWKRPSTNPIAFDFVGYPEQGMPLHELFFRGAHALQHMMEGADDMILADTGLESINFHISWPGYEHVEWNRDIEIITSRGPITRSHLGNVVAQHFTLFIERAQVECSKAEDWHLGRGGIRLEHIILLCVHNVSEDTWQAEVAVDFQ